MKNASEKSVLNLPIGLDWQAWLFSVVISNLAGLLVGRNVMISKSKIHKLYMKYKGSEEDTSVASFPFYIPLLNYSF